MCAKLYSGCEGGKSQCVTSSEVVGNSKIPASSNDELLTRRVPSVHDAIHVCATRRFSHDTSFYDMGLSL